MRREKVQCIVYFISNGEPSFLLLRTTEKRGGFWQCVTGSVEEGETHLQAAERELKEETGLLMMDALNVISDVYSFSFRDRRGDNVTESVFGIQIASKLTVDLKHNVYDEHVTSEWLDLHTACSRLRFEDEVNSLQAVYDNIKKSR